MGYPDTFTGFCVASPKTWSDFSKSELKPKTWDSAHDVDVEIAACGVCGSDVHTITGGWGDFEGPLCVGHEVIGKAVRVGSHVKNIKEGDRVGVGAQVWSCMECDLCLNQNENYCPKLVDTYNAQFEDGSWAHGGFASHIRAHEQFVFPIPDGISDEDAAPLMCAGLTTFSPLVRAGVGKGKVKTVGVVGIGGLGHLGVQWAAALGATVYAFSHSPSKVDDCKKLGAKDVILTNEDGWEENWKLKFDFILNCADMTSEFDMSKYLGLMKPGGDFHMVGLPDKPLPEMPAFLFAGNGPKLAGSHLGNYEEMMQLLKLAAEKGIKPWVETIPVSEKGLKEAVERVHENKVKYRFTMTGFRDVFSN